jgi:hypothetical protein
MESQQQEVAARQMGEHRTADHVQNDRAPDQQEEYDGAPKPQTSRGMNQVGDVAATASAVFSGAASWLSRVGMTAKEYAAVAGERIDRAADSINNTVDQCAQQVHLILF